MLGLCRSAWPAAPGLGRGLWQWVGGVSVSEHTLSTQAPLRTLVTVDLSRPEAVDWASRSLSRAGSSGRADPGQGSEPLSLPVNGKRPARLPGGFQEQLSSSEHKAQAWHAVGVQ